MPVPTAKNSALFLSAFLGVLRGYIIALGVHVKNFISPRHKVFSHLCRHDLKLKMVKYVLILKTCKSVMKQWRKASQIIYLGSAFFVVIILAMDTQDKVGATNKQHWERLVAEGCGFTQPWLDLDRALLQDYIHGRLQDAPEPYILLYPASFFAGVGGKDVLCLASGGGQQSAVFGFLGARVTVVDLIEGQLEGDRAAAAHYGYQVTTLQADMRDLSTLNDGAFDLVYQAPSMAYVPDVRPVYAGVYRVLRHGGLYRVCFTNPATEFVDWNSWDGEGYRITKPYSDRIEGAKGGGAEGSIQFRHTMADIFNGLVAEGFSIQQVEDDPQHRAQRNAEAQPGSWEHWLTYVVGFAVVARKG